MVGWLVGCLVGWLMMVAWLVGWLVAIGWLIVSYNDVISPLLLMAGVFNVVSLVVDA